jgi:hypothetical protein
MQPQPRRAASIAAMSIFFICIIASNARLAEAGSGSVTAWVRASGVIRRDTRGLSLHQPHGLLAAVADDRVPVTIRFNLVILKTPPITPFRATSQRVILQ